MEDWLLSQRRPRTKKPYRSAINAYLAWCRNRGLDPLAAVRRDIDKYRHHLAERRKRNGRRLSAATQCRHLSTLASFYRFAVRGPYGIEVNPTEHVQRPEVDKESKREGLLLHEAHAVLAASITADERTAAVVHLLLSTGLRVSEACGVDTRDVGWSSDNLSRTVKVERKGGKDTVVPLQLASWRVIERYLNVRPQGPTGPLLMTQRGAMSPSTAWQIVTDLTSAVVPNKTISPHSLRHTATTLALDAGQPLQEVQVLMGHSSPATTLRYDRARQSRGHAASRALGEALFGAQNQVGDALTRKDDAG